jgi:tRNA (adenine37-N6)-methyltransferase
MNEYFNIKAIGHVISPVKKMIDKNWSNIVSTIVVKEDHIQGIEGLDEFSHAIIVTFLHQANFDVDQHLQRHPRGKKDLAKIGIFSQRAKHRPNPIGITTVQIVKLKEERLIVKGLDAIDGTPVIDIKPYYPHYDCVKDAVIPDWVNAIMENYF